MSVCVAIKIFARYVAVFSCAGIFWGENKEKVIGELWVNKVGINRKKSRLFNECKFANISVSKICKSVKYKALYRNVEKTER